MHLFTLLLGISLDEMIDTTPISVHWIPNMKLLFIFAYLKDWKQVETASLALSKGNKTHLPAPLKFNN